MHDRLNKLGFDVKVNDIISSLGAAQNIIESQHLKPMLLLAPEAMEDFEHLKCLQGETPNAVVVGLAPTEFHYERLNEAFRYVIVFLLSFVNVIILDVFRKVLN